MKELTDEMIERAIAETGYKLVPGVTMNHVEHKACILGIQCVNIAARRSNGYAPLIYDMSCILKIDEDYAYGVVNGFDGMDPHGESSTSTAEQHAVHMKGYNFGKRWREKVLAE